MSATNSLKVDTAWTEQMRDVAVEEAVEKQEIAEQVAALQSERRHAQLEHMQERNTAADEQHERATRAFESVMDRAGAALANALARLEREAAADEAALTTEFDEELAEIREGHAADVQLQNTIIDTIREARRECSSRLAQAGRAAEDAARNRAEESYNVRAITLQARVEDLEARFAAAHAQYTNATSGASAQLRLLAAKDKHDSAVIEEQEKRIKHLRSQVSVWKERLSGLAADYGRRNAGLTREREAALAEYLTLRGHHSRMKQDIRRDALVLSKASRASLDRLEKHVNMAEEIVRAHRLCTRLETVEEQIWPFGREEMSMAAITDGARRPSASAAGSVAGGAAGAGAGAAPVSGVDDASSQLRRFYRRTNNTLLDLNCLEQEYRELRDTNSALRDAVQAYLNDSGPMV